MTLAERVEGERRRLRGTGQLGGALLALATAGLALAIGIAALGSDRWLRLPALLPWIVWAAALALAGTVLLRAHHRSRREAGMAQVAAAIERDQRLRGGALRVALEVQESGSLGRRAADDVAQRLSGSQLALAPSLRTRVERRTRVAAGAAAIAVLALATAGFAAGDGWAPLAHPLDAARGTLLPAIVLEAPAHALRGEPVPVRIVAPKRHSILLHMRPRGAAWRTETIALADGAGEARLPSDADVMLVATDGRATSDTVVVRIVDRPFVGDVSLEAVFPAYLRRAPEPLAAGEPARVPRGTTILLRGRASTELRTIALEGAGASIALQPAGHGFSGRFVPAASGRWSWRAVGTAGPVADVPPPIDLEIVPDSAPHAELLAPGSDTTVTASEQLRVAIGASDDHGLSSVELRTVRRTAAGITLPATSARLQGAAPSPWMGEAVLDLSSRGLEPGDELRVTAIATDASPWAQRGESRTIVLRVPTLTEQRTIARQAADSTVALAASAAAAQRDLQRRTGDAARSRGDRARTPKETQASQSASRGDQPPQAMSYDAAEQARAIAKEQRALAERVQKLQEAARGLERQLKEAGALDAALAERLAEVQQLLRDALTPELAAELEQLEQSAQKLQGDQARQNLADLAAQQRRLREQLEKSVEMLKRAALEGSMETLRDEAKELADAQRVRADSLAGRRPQRADSAARDAATDGAKLAERSEDLSKDLEKLAERLQKEGAETGARHAEKAAEHAGNSAERMQPDGKSGSRPDAQREARREAGEQEQQRQAGEQGQRGGQQGQRSGGDERESREAQDPQAAMEAADEMKQAAEAMAAAREQQVDEWKQELAQEIDRSIIEALQLARTEEQLAEEMQSRVDGTGGVPSRQGAVQQGAEKLSERMAKAGQKSSHLSQRSQRALAEAARKVGEATREASERRPGNGAANAMREAATALNQAAASLVRDRDRLGSASSASGFAESLQRMRELAKQQGQIAAQAQGLSLMPGQSGQPNPAQMAQGARALAKSQREVADALQEVGDGDASGRAEQLAEEARRLAQALERGAIDQSIIDRQQRLFRRLLDAGKTLEQEERDDQGKREARAASGNETFSPGTDAAGRAALKFRQPDWNDLRGLSAEERRLVLEYFKRLNAEQP